MDILELEKLILGVYTELPNNTSWRFVAWDFVFPDPNNPFATVFPESITVQNIQTPVEGYFVGIKVGDVNNTAVANLAGISPDERGQDIHASLSIGQPYPNPMAEMAMLPVHLPTAENLQLEILDLSGKVLWFNNLKLNGGAHTLEIPATAMPAHGIYLWRVVAGDQIKSGKLIRM